MLGFISAEFFIRFSPKAAAVKPSMPSVFVQYSIKASNMPSDSEIDVNTTYRISVSAFREHFPVSVQVYTWIGYYV